MTYTVRRTELTYTAEMKPVDTITTEKFDNFEEAQFCALLLNGEVFDENGNNITAESTKDFRSSCGKGIHDDGVEGYGHES